LIDSNAAILDIILRKKMTKKFLVVIKWNDCKMRLLLRDLSCAQNTYSFSDVSKEHPVFSIQKKNINIKNIYVSVIHTHTHIMMSQDVSELLS